MLADLLADLDAAGIVLWWDGVRLRYRAPGRALTPALREGMSRRREQLIAAIQARGNVLLPLDPRRWPVELAHSFEERAAIMECDGRLLRNEAEKRALAYVKDAWLRAHGSGETEA